MVGRELQNHLDEFAGVRWETSLEPQERDDTTDTDVLFEDVRDTHTSVHELLTTLVRDGGDEGGRLSDKSELGRPLVVHGDGRWLDLRFGRDGARRDKLGVGLLEHFREVLESVRNDEAGGSHGSVLGIGGLHV